MSKIIVTGFKPFSLLTYCTGNPSEIIATELGKRYGANAHVSLLNADATCLNEIGSMSKLSGVGGMIMLGAAMQSCPVTLELEGVCKSDGLFGASKSTLVSQAAVNLQGFAQSMGVPTATAPITPLVYWCLRSYAAALEWTQPRGIPCVFLHVNTLRLSTDIQVDIAAKFFEKLQRA